jgi:hypothetical protein
MDKQGRADCSTYEQSMLHINLPCNLSSKLYSQVECHERYAQKTRRYSLLGAMS